ncbi:hydroxyneurosporene methyltransferase-like protein, partial [Leptotrombidium deliense]
MQACHSKLLETIKTGKCYFEEIYGLKVYDWLKCKPESMETFVYGMQEYNDALGSKLVELYDFSHFNRIIDVGGGQGWLMSKILKIAPNAKGTVHDQAIVVEKAYENEFVSDVRDQISFVGGNFMENVPSGGDCYILQNIIVDYDDENAMKLLRNIAENMDENTKLVIIKQTLDT